MLIEALLLLAVFLVLLVAGMGIWRRLAGRPRRSLFRLVRIALLSIVLAPAVGFATYRLMNARTFQLAGEIIPAVPVDQPLVALTFDDGPALPYTEEILAVLGERGAKATFFVTGAALAQQPDLGRRILQEGHELGNHSYSHQRMVFKSMEFIRTELEQTDALIRQAGATGEIHFRSPFGKKLLLLPLYLGSVNKKNIFVSVEPDSYADVAASAEGIVAHVLARTQPGSIILLHAETESRTTSRQALPGIIDGLQARGYQFVTVSELLAAQGTASAP
jgi:peptidoglycan/xylan/chitin deacetylase (PgdA/CDA1 family)